MIALIRNGLFGVSKSLGFRKREKTPKTAYMFIGNKDMLEQCKSIALNNGLDAEYVNGSQDSRPEGHLRNIHSDPDRLVYIVYDMTVYSFSHVLSIFADCPMKHISIGTYYNNILITAEEVMRYE